ncbi:glycosyltransferase [Paenibacillus sp. LMG 31460]|uniref:Glycosyltransferase n=1 Tax=Paenibacillus germinis TaxID=2654979 RepID=A0ABX1Z9P7_9BACL|nr:glycosyltransferase family 4 protein [Paenibacillus germinis]NOU88999.1 glycosyltransferase [Paenibacillus germinis]
MKKMLMLASVSSMIDQFNMPNIKLLQEMGYQVDVACNFGEGNTSSPERVKAFKQELEGQQINYYQIEFARNILKIGENIKAYKQVKDLLEKNRYNFIHCHSPIGGVVGRLAAHNTKTKVIYTAHGFHFFKGAPLVNWLFYYPVEKFFSRYTDVLITINNEDYERAVKYFNAKKTMYIPGIGVDTTKFGGSTVDRDAKRNELGVTADETMILSVGELIKRKNQDVVIKALAKMADKKVKYYICGRGELNLYLRHVANEQGVENQVVFLGFRTDVSDICKAADIFVFPSLQEGLPVALMEAMAAGLPVVSSEIRGNTDLIENGRGGYLVKPDDVEGFSNSITKIVSDYELRDTFREKNLHCIKKFDLSNVQDNMKSIYINISIV